MSGDDVVRRQLQALGGFIRDRRLQAELSLRDLAERADVSNPYLSQIERGLHEPSVRVLKAIAGALEVPVEALLAQAGLVDRAGPEGGGPQGGGPAGTEAAILADPGLGEAQRQALLAVYRSYVAANRTGGGPGPAS